MARYGIAVLTNNGIEILIFLHSVDIAFHHIFEHRIALHLVRMVKRRAYFLEMLAQFFRQLFVEEHRLRLNDFFRHYGILVVDKVVEQHHLGFLTLSIRAILNLYLAECQIDQLARAAKPHRIALDSRIGVALDHPHKTAVEQLAIRTIVVASNHQQLARQ